MYVSTINAVQRTGIVVVSTEYSAPTNGGSNITVAPTNNLALTFNNVSAGNVAATSLTPSQVPSLPSNFSFPGNTPMYNITTTGSFTGNITVTFQVPNIADAVTCGQLRILHYTNTWDYSNNAAPVYDSTNQTCTLSQTVTSLSPFAVAKLAAPPTAAHVLVGGRVMDANENGIKSARIR
jgi:hypothetical protein